ncbi:hypothetical protein Hanom_Chr09g00812891 [Helianthus anomalus]
MHLIFNKQRSVLKFKYKQKRVYHYKNSTSSGFTKKLVKTTNIIHSQGYIYKKRSKKYTYRPYNHATTAKKNCLRSFVDTNFPSDQ